MKTRYAWIAGLLGAAFFFTLITAAIFVALSASPTGAPRGILVLELGGEIPEEPSGTFFDRWITGETKTVLDISRMLRRAEGDRRVEAVLAKIGPLEEGWGKVQEIRDALASFSRTGKPTVAFLEHAGTREYYLATGAGRIAMTPSGALLLNGVALHLPFARQALDKVRVRADIEHVGSYKSAGEVYTRDQPSSENLVAMNSLLDSLYDQLVKGISASRNLAEEKVREVVDRGILSARQARDAGLVDDLAYEDQAGEALRKKIRGRVADLEEGVYLAGTRRIQPGAARIAMVYATGTIVSGRSSGGGYGGRLMGSDTVADAIGEAARDGGIRAIVLRVDSPGGSGVASDVIWRQTQLARRRKPVIVSMSDMAASGGYWISMGSDSIVAEPATLTASIGVLGGKFDLGGLYEWAGLHWEVLQRGRHADLFTDVHGFTEEQRKILRENLTGFYDEFVRKVAEGRGMKREEVERAAQGRVWTGEKALELGLVDRLGGIDTAVDLAREKAGLPKDRPIALVIFPRSKSLFESLRDGDLVQGRSDLPRPLRRLAAGIEIAERLREEVALPLLLDTPPVH